MEPTNETAPQEATYQPEAGMPHALVYLQSSNKVRPALYVKGEVDMPGVLAAGRVSGGGGMGSNQWGCKDCTCVKHNGQVGRYKITHDIGHTKYFTTANLTNDGGLKAQCKTPVGKSCIFVVY